MAKIPYFFNTPVPKYFFESGWLNPEKNKKMYFNNLAFLTWAFSRCNPFSYKIILESKEVLLEPFEFVCGRDKNSRECGLTPDQFRTQLNSYQNAGLLKKTPNSLPNHYSCYVWVTEHFIKNDPQQNASPIPNRSPTDPHNKETRTKNKEYSYKENNNKDSSFIQNVVVDFINQLPLSEKEKKVLIKDNPSLEKIQHAWEDSEKEIIQTTLIQYLRWHLKQKERPIPKESFISILSKNFKNGHVYNGATCYLNVDYIAFERGMKNIEVKFCERDYKKKVINALNLFGIKHEFEMA